MYMKLIVTFLNTKSFNNHPINSLYFITCYVVKMSFCQDAEDKDHKYEYDDEAEFFATMLFPRKVVFVI